MALIIKKKSCVIFCRYLVGHHNLSSKKYFPDLREISNLPNSKFKKNLLIYQKKERDQNCVNQTYVNHKIREP
jgi:hypothetical protein